MTKLIERTITPCIINSFFKGRAVIIYGARRVGKTTLIRQIQAKYVSDSLYLSCDEPDIRSNLTERTSTELKALIGDKKIVFIDEAQRVKNIGLTLKLLVDNFPQAQIVATGSSSFDLSNKIVEPLTGRKYEFQLFPFSFAELKQIYSLQEINRLLERIMIYGLYPEVIQRPQEAGIILKEISRSYLYKDILAYQQVKNPELLEKLLQALALQAGNQVSFNELASLLGIDKITVAKYVELLEKGFVILRLRPYSRNPRKELAKTRKIYFVDVGIRNALINNFNSLDLRQDTGSLWENFLLSERIKSASNLGRGKNFYFWRTLARQEIDLVEEEEGSLSGFEFKWSGKRRAKPPSTWTLFYPKAEYQVITPENYQEFLS